MRKKLRLALRLWKMVWKMKGLEDAKVRLGNAMGQDDAEAMEVIAGLVEQVAPMSRLIIAAGLAGVLGLDLAIVRHDEKAPARGKEWVQ